MKLSSTITIKDVDIPLFTKCFKPELNSLQSQRSLVEFETKEDQVIFKIQAKDSVALRATANSITKLITVFEKAEVKNE